MGRVGDARTYACTCAEKPFRSSLLHNIIIFKCQTQSRSVFVNMCGVATYVELHACSPFRLMVLLAWYLPVLLFSPSSVPSAAPEFSVTAVTATSLTITWQPLPPCERNGVITNYTIAYRMEGGMDMSFREVVVVDTRLMHVVESLTPYTNYTIKMAATTSVGRGEFGPEMTVETYESSKLQSVQLSFHLLHMSLPNLNLTVSPFHCKLLAVYVCSSTVEPLYKTPLGPS